MLKTFDSFELTPTIVGGLFASCLGLDLHDEHCPSYGECCGIVAVRPFLITQEHENCKPALYKMELTVDVLVGCEEQTYLSVLDELYCCLKTFTKTLEISEIEPVCTEKCKGWRLKVIVWVRPHNG